VNKSFHFFFEGRFLFEDTNENIVSLPFSEVSSFPWISCGMFSGLILAFIETSGSTYCVLLSTGANALLQAYDIPETEPDSDQSNLLKTFYSDFKTSVDKSKRSRIEDILKKRLYKNEEQKLENKFPPGMAEFLRT
jgi:hypothetical protein